MPTAQLASDVIAYLRAHDTEPETSVESVDMTSERTLFIPAYDATAFAGDDLLTPPLGDYSMRLFDSAMPALPLSHVGYKTAYHLILRSFPSKARVQVTALRASRGDGATLTKKGGTGVPWRFPLAIVTTDETGAASVAIKFGRPWRLPQAITKFKREWPRRGRLGFRPCTRCPEKDIEGGFRGQACGRE